MQPSVLARHAVAVAESIVALSGYDDAQLDQERITGDS